MDASIWGYANRIYKSVKDIMTLYALEKALFNAVSYNFTETQIETLIFKIREFLGMINYTSRVDYFLARYPSLECSNEKEGPYVSPGDGSGGDITNIINNYYPTTYITEKSSIIDNTEWYSQNLTPLIVSDGQVTISNLNFNIADVDIDSVLLEVQGDDPEYTVSGQGYHIVGSTLHWHNFYDLKIGMQVKIRWRI
jgi:hypothetical protein